MVYYNSIFLLKFLVNLKRTALFRDGERTVKEMVLLVLLFQGKRQRERERERDCGAAII